MWFKQYYGLVVDGSRYICAWLGNRFSNDFDLHAKIRKSWHYVWNNFYKICADHTSINTSNIEAYGSLVSKGRNSSVTKYEGSYYVG